MILAADNLHALNPVVAEALEKLDARPVQAVARACEKAGSRWIDLNPGYLPRHREDRMAFLVEAVQEVTGMQLILDSPHARVLAKGLAVCRDRPMLNALTLEKRKIDEILPLAAAHKAQLVILLLDENSRSPQRMEEKISLALQLRELAFSAGLPLDDLIFDPFLVNLSWPDAFLQVAETVKTVRMLASGALFQEPVKTMVGLSNLRSGVRRHTPQQVEEICLGLLAGAGLWSVLANALDAELVKAWRLMEQMSQEAAD